MKKLLRHVFISFIVVIVSGLIGTLLLVAVYHLPTNRLKSHVQKGTYVYNLTGSFPEIVNSYSTTILDLQTDAIMFENAVYPTNNALTDAMLVPRIHIVGWEASEVNSLLDYVNDVQGKEMITQVYPRYWHGYLVYFKLILTLFDFADMQIINMIFQCLLWMALFVEFVKKGLSDFIPALFAFMIAMHPLEIMMSFQITDCFVIAALTSIFLLKFENAKFIQKDGAIFVFLFVGIVTSYIDFLTYPLVTLAIPLTILTVTRTRESSAFWSPLMVIENSFFWALGYIGMWMMKWAIGSMILKQNLFVDAFGEVSVRLSSGSEQGDTISRLSAITANIKGFGKVTYVAFAIFVIMWILWDRVHRYRSECLPPQTVSGLNDCDLKISIKGLVSFSNTSILFLIISSFLSSSLPSFLL